MRVLITVLNFHSLVPLAQALQTAGHEVTLAGSSGNGPMAEAVGLGFFPAGTDMQELLPELQSQIAVVPEEQRGLWLLKNGFGDILPQRMVPDLLAVCRRWKPDVIVREMAEFGGCIVAEHLGLAHASVEVGAFMPAAWTASVMEQQLDRVRASVGLPPDPNLDMLYRYLHLSFAPPSYQDPNAPLPSTAHALRTVIFDRTGDEELPTWVEQLPDRPTVYATLGRVFNREPGVLAAILEGLRDEPINLIVTVGRDQDPTQFGPQPPHIHIERYIPQSSLLAQCDLVISHGGWNTVLATLYHGLPSVLIPLGADQSVNAKRCAALGVSHVIERAGFSPEAVRDAARQVLHTPQYHANARRMQEEMQSLPGPEYAVELLERLVHGDA